jgi:MoxR-like ATPase
MKKIFVSLAEAFGTLSSIGTITPLEGIPLDISLEVTQWDDTDGQMASYVPKQNLTYVMPKSLLRDLQKWDEAGQMMGKYDSLYLFGPTGSGKSSGIKKFCEVKGIPLLVFPCSENTEAFELFGTTGITGGDTKFDKGLVIMAAELGIPVLLDEFDKLRPEVSVALNGVFDFVTGEASAFSVPGSKEIVLPKAGFTLIGTGNTNLGGNASMNYHTSKMQDNSTKERWALALQLDYPVAEERLVLMNELSKLDDPSLEYLFDAEDVQVSTKSGLKKGNLVSRDDFVDGVQAFVASVRKQSADSGNISASALERTISLRKLRQWIRYTIVFANASTRGESALHYSLERVLTNTCNASTAITIHSALTTVLGVKHKKAP